VRPTILAIDEARFGREAVALVVAENAGIAMDPPKALHVEYEAMAARHRMRCAASRDAGNVIVDLARPANAAAAQAASPGQSMFVRTRGLTSHASPACRWSRGPRLAIYDAGTGAYTLLPAQARSGAPKRGHAIIFGIDSREKVRVIAHDIGGNFGTRNFFYPEFALVCWAARKVGRPVKWTSSRQETFLTDYAGRDFRIESPACARCRGHLPRPQRPSASAISAPTPPPSCR